MIIKYEYTYLLFFFEDGHKIDSGNCGMKKA